MGMGADNEVLLYVIIQFTYGVMKQKKEFTHVNTKTLHRAIGKMNMQ